MVKPAFRLVGRAAGIQVHGDLLYRFDASGDGAGWVVDDVTGATLAVPAPCDLPPLFDGPLVAIEQCPHAVGTAPHLIIDNLQTRKQQQVVVPGAECVEPAECGVVGFGSKWLEYAVGCYHCQTRIFLQALHDGHVRAAPATDETSRLELNAARPLRHWCRPLQVRQFQHLTFLFQRFALLTQDGNPLNRLERCGSRSRRTLDDHATAASSTVLTWTSTSTHLDGLQLPRLRRFRVQIPPNVGIAGTDFALTTQHLYAHSPDGRLWQASVPRMPRPTQGSPNTVRYPGQGVASPAAPPPTRLR